MLHKVHHEKLVIVHLSLFIGLSGRNVIVSAVKDDGGKSLYMVGVVESEELIDG